MNDDFRIELIDTDPAIFGEAPAVVPRPRWVVPAAVAACAAVAAVGLLIWQPWQHEPQPPMSNRLALRSQPFNEVESVELDSQWDGPSAAEVGLTYAEPGARIGPDADPNSRSARWVAVAVDSPTLAGDGGTPTADVQGTPARIGGASGVLLQLRFGPIAGRRFIVSTIGLTTAETLAFAEQIAVVDGEPILRNDEVLDGMRQVGTGASYDTATTLIDDSDYGPQAAPVTTVTYIEGDDRVSIASVVDPEGEVLRTLMLLTGEQLERSIGGQERLTANLDGADLFGGYRTLVAWRERGRLIAVRSPFIGEEAQRVADTAVELNEAEWQQIARQATAPGAGGFDSGVGSVGAFPAAIGFRTSANGEIDEIVALPTDTPGTQRWALCLFTAVGSDCVDHRGSDEPPWVEVHSIHGVELIVAIAPEGSHEPMLRVTHAGGVDLHLLFRPGGSRTLPGPAVAIFPPDDTTLVELLVDGEVVATL